MEFAKGGQGLCDELASLNDSQSGMLILRYCHTNRINHLARSVYPTLLKPATRFHDELTEATFRQLVCCDIGEQQWLQATLPIRNGGFSVSSMVSTCPIAFASSWARSLAHLSQSFGDLTDLVKNISRAVQHPGHKGSIASHLLQALPGNKSLVDLINNPKKLQQKLKSEQTEQIVSSILSNPLSQRSAARFRSLQRLGAGAWLDSIPSSAKLALKPSDFRLAMRMGLGLEMTLGSVVPICECGKDIDKDSYHLLTCKTGGGPIWTHETLTSV